ncbi:MAG: extracellular solute-binding protein [Chloroflexi bacterium]|nr:extracellular solute-binding protein [Chloroflexota bacterium]
MHRTSRIATLVAAAAVIGTAVPAVAQDSVAFTLWTKEGEADGSLQYVQALATAYEAAHANVKITVVNKDVEALREDFLTSSLAGQAPELLWTVADHLGPFTASNTILALDGVVDTSGYLPNAVSAVQADGVTYGVPVSYGNHLMLYTNKALVAECPADSDALLAAAQANTGDGNYGLVFNQTESFWLVPFLGGYGGRVFAEDGVTPTLGTEAMTSALSYIKGLKYTDQVMPAEADYNVADGMFKNGAPGATPEADAATGVAAMIINGDWTLGEYARLFGDQLNVCPIPQIAGHEWPAPYAAGSFYMVGRAVGDDAAKLAAVSDFVSWSTDTANQVAMVEQLRRLPANTDALADPVVAGDAFLAGSAAAIEHAIPQPTNLEMRCVFDSMTAGVRDLFASADSDPAAIAATMQSSAEVGVAPGGECGPA